MKPDCKILQLLTIRKPETVRFHKFQRRIISIMLSHFELKTTGHINFPHYIFKGSKSKILQ